MSGQVGVKGTIVIDKELRDRLGVQPGWQTVQLLRDGHVEAHFLPPQRPGASAGIWRPMLQPGLFRTNEQLDEAISDAYAEAAVERYDRSLAPADEKSEEKAT